MNPQDNLKLADAFPCSVRADALTAFSALPENPHGGKSFAVRVNDEQLSIPYRVHHNPMLITGWLRWRLSPLQKHFIDCVMTRHRRTNS